ALRRRGSGDDAPAGFATNANPVGIIQPNQTASSAGMTLGYLPRSAAFINTWSPAGDATIRERWGRTNVRAAIQILGFVPSASPTIERIDITVNFALNEAPFFAPFYAWQYVDLPGQHVKSSSPLTFTANVPQAAGIAAAFRLKSAASGVHSSGSLYYQIGGSGLGPGIYGLAGPSATTGLTPDWSQITWGEKAGSLARSDGMAVDFDYVTLIVSPVRAG
ncbi:MAG: hypothetical protein ABI569_17155, partial [Casimicrobiaceae bacterium]